LNLSSGGKLRLAFAACAVLLGGLLVCGCGASVPTGVPSTDVAADSSYPGILAHRYDDVFPDDRVQTVRIVLKAADWEAMRTGLKAKEYYRGDIWIDDEQVKDVAVRAKGSSSLMGAAMTQDFRVGLKVDFNFFNSARSYHGIKKLVYNNGFGDPTLMKEFLGYELMAEMGVPSPRACFVDMWVNDTHMGVYTQVEAVDARFVEENFDDSKGNLYKPEIAAGKLDWTEEDAIAQAARKSTASTTTTTESFNLGGGNLGEIIERLGDDAGWMPGRPEATGDSGTVAPRALDAERITDLLASVGLKTNEDQADYSRLYKLLKVLNSDPGEVSADQLEEVLDVDEVLRYLAVSVVLVHLDNYISRGHNYYLYDNGGRFSIIPWDMNMVFGKYDVKLPRDAVLQFYIDEPTVGPVSQYPLVERLLDEPKYKEAYHAHLRELIEGPFSLEHMTVRVNEIADLIRPYVENDHTMFYSAEAFELNLTTDLMGESLSRTQRVAGTDFGLTFFVQRRIASIESQLSGESPAGSGDGSGNTANGSGNTAAAAAER
jgi:spore coat protein CotH